MVLEPTSLRSDWSFEVVRLCQHAVEELQEIDPAAFIDGFAALSARLLQPASAAERLFLRDRLCGFTTSAARYFHATFHNQYDQRACGSRIAELATSVWADTDWSAATANQTRLLKGWANTYISIFERDHQWPIAVRAAARLRRDFGQHMDVSSLARSIGCSRSVLIRKFEGRFGVGVHEYLTLVRVREALCLLRSQSWSVDAIAAAVGYRSAKSLYAAIRKLTGLLPDDVRRLGDGPMMEILHSAARLPSARTHADIRPAL